jgi:hypothetical protein
MEENLVGLFIFLSRLKFKVSDNGWFKRKGFISYLLSVILAQNDWPITGLDLYSSRGLLNSPKFFPAINYLVSSSASTQPKSSQNNRTTALF